MGGIIYTQGKGKTYIMLNGKPESAITQET